MDNIRPLRLRIFKYYPVSYFRYNLNQDLQISTLHQIVPGITNLYTNITRILVANINPIFPLVFRDEDGTLVFFLNVVAIGFYQFDLGIIPLKINKRGSGLHVRTTAGSVINASISVSGFYTKI